jgi:hypothetical protein
MIRTLRSGAARRAATRLLWALGCAILVGLAAAQTPDIGSTQAPAELDPAEVRSIAKQAWIYAFAPILNYQALYKQAIDTRSSDYIGGFGVYAHDATLRTPQSRDVQFPDNDMAVSRAWLDLRAEPWVLSVPAVPTGRYNDFQWFDLYTHNFAYVGVRSTGRHAGNYLFAGPGWHGKVPRGIAKVFRSETPVIGTVTRTSLAGPDDIPAVKALQAEYRLRPLSAFLGEAAAPAAPGIDWPTWYVNEAMGLDFIRYLNFLMSLMQPPPQNEKDMLGRFARIGIGAGRPFEPDKLDPELRLAIEQGIGDAKQALAERLLRTSSTQELFGTREELGGDYLMKRTLGARMELHGNSKAEAVHPMWLRDAKGEPLLGSARYQITFPAGQLPPATEFWSATVYRLPDRMLVDNPLGRYALGSHTPGLKYGADGSLTLYVQHDPPGEPRGSNWLPSPEGPFAVFLRLSAPKMEALTGVWKLPDIVTVP